MTRKFTDQKLLKLRFGGGLHSRASEEDVDPRECASGENFRLDTDNQQYRPRKPFDLIGTVPNGSEIRGAATLIKSDGTISVLIQGGNKVYDWDGSTGFTEVATVNASSKLRGRLEHNWQLDDKVIITDIELVETVKEWDGTTFQDITFTDEEGYNFGTFKARYCYVSNERAIFANVHSNGLDTPHLIVGSQRSNFEVITIVNRPSSAASGEDPFFLVQPDNQYINGLVEAFGTTIISSKLGSLYKLTGSSAVDFDIDSLLARGGSSSDEALQLAVNDVVLGAQGRLKSVSATDKFGNVESSDLSFWIGGEIEDFDDWLIATNQRLEITYFHPSNESRFYVLYHSLIGSQVSPWSKWTTENQFAMNPTFMMNILDPIDGLEYVIMGDSNGNLYRLEGSGTSGDAGVTPVKSFRLSKLFSAESEGKLFDLDGYIRYRRQNSIEVLMRIEYSGEHVMKENVTFTFPAPIYNPVYGTTAHYGTQYFYGTDQGFIVRQSFAVAGSSNDFQVRITVEDSDEWTINEVGFRYEEAN